MRRAASHWRRALGDQLVDAERAQPLGLRDVGASANPARRAACTQVLERDVGGDVLRRRASSSGVAAAVVAAVGAQPPAGAALDELGAGRRRSRRPRAHAAAQHAARTPRATRRRRGRHRQPRRRRHRCRGDDVGVGRELVGGRHEHLDEARRRRAPTRTSRQPSPVPLDDAEQEVVEQLVGEHHAVDRERGQLVERGDDRPDAGRPAPASSSVVGARTGRARRRRLERQAVALLGPQRRRPLDEHVAQRRPRTRARRASTSRRAGRCPAPASTTTNGSGRPSSRHQPSSARATHAPNSGPTSGLVTKSRPARPAPPPA